MGSLGSIVRMVAQRSVGHWRLFLAMTVGATLAAALMASVVLYSDAVRDLGLKHSLESQPPLSLDVRLVSSSQRFNSTEEPRLRATIDSLVQGNLGSVISGVTHYGRSATFFPTAPGEAVSKDEQKPRAHFQFVDDLQGHTHLVEGRLPTPFTAGKKNEAPAIEVLLGGEAARKYGIAVGAVYELHPHWQEKAAPVRVTVVGIVDPDDLSEPYWFGKDDRFGLRTTWPTFPLFVDEATLIQGVGTYLPDMEGTLEEYAFVDTGLINHTNAHEIENRAKALKTDVAAKLKYSYAETRLENVISSYREKLFFTRLPLFALMLQVVGIVLFYLVMVSAMVVERQAGEVALLKSRGAGTFQVMTIFVIEGLGITLFATVAGPLVAWGSIAVLGLTPPFEELSGGSLLDVTLTPLGFAMSFGGAALALAALLWPAYRACKFSITTYKQQISRPQRQPVFLRYYIDLVLIGAAAFAFYQLRQSGSLVTEGLFGDLSVDPLLLATPTLFMLMAALVFLRLFPLFLQLLLWLARGLAGPTVSLGLTRMARSPLQHSRLILILILATAVGMFAAGFRSTLERGYEDRAAYQAGSETRLEDIRTPSSQPRELFRKNLADATGSSDVMPALRMNAYYSPTRYTSRTISMLGVDPDAFARIAFWRDDFAGERVVDLLRDVRSPAAATGQEGGSIPAGARYLGVWALNPLPPAQAPIGIRLRDGDGSIWEYRLITEVQPAPNTWQFYVADLTRPTATRPQGVTANAAERHWTFEAVYVQLPGAPPMQSQQISVLFDDFQTASQAAFPPGWGKAGFAESTVIETFDDLSGFDLVRGISSVGDPGSLSRAEAPAPRTGPVARLSFIRGKEGSPIVGARLKIDLSPVPVVASQTFLDDNDKSVGDELTLSLNSQFVKVKIVGSFELFPSFDPEGSTPLFVTDFEQLRAAATRVPGAGSNVYANEAWLGAGTPTTISRESLAGRGVAVERVLNRGTILAEQSSDPLVAASWEGILFLAFAAVIVVSTLGFVTYTTLGAQARSLEFAILRTMGLSSRQVLGVVSFEQVFVVVAGVITGTLLGFPLSRLMIGYLGLTEDGRDPLPPLQSVVNWQSIGTVYAFLGIVVASTVVALVLLYSRLAVSRALRMGEL
jgi:putative ABC transport system permease protein